MLLWFPFDVGGACLFGLGFQLFGVWWWLLGGGVGCWLLFCGWFLLGFVYFLRKVQTVCTWEEI